MTAISAAALACMAVFGGCIGGTDSVENPHGGSDGIENPKFEVGLEGPDGGSSGEGLLRVYAVDYNPVSDSVPLFEKSFVPGRPVVLMAKEVDSLLKARLGGPAVLVDTVIGFNVVAVAGDKEVFASGFRYQVDGKKRRFALPSAIDPATPFGKDVKALLRLRSAVMGYQGAVGGAGQSYGIDYVFIPGSPYHAVVKEDLPDGRKGGFRFERMSQGTYSLIGVVEDSAQFFESADTLDTKDPEFSAGAWAPITFIDK